jgi:adenosine deaminase
VMDLCKENNITLEICLTSNWLTSAVSTTASHPIKRLMDYGVPITINSDDPSLFGIDLCHEYEILYREHGFTEEDFRACNQRAADASFINPTEKSRVWPSP